jgi:hypothetical protein
MTRKEMEKKRWEATRLKRVAKSRVIKFFRLEVRGGRMEKSFIRRISVKVVINENKGEKND